MKNNWIGLPSVVGISRKIFQESPTRSDGITVIIQEIYKCLLPNVTRHLMLNQKPLNNAKYQRVPKRTDALSNCFDYHQLTTWKGLKQICKWRQTTLNCFPKQAIFLLVIYLRLEIILLYVEIGGNKIDIWEKSVDCGRRTMLYLSVFLLRTSTVITLVTFPILYSSRKLLWAALPPISQSTNK